MFTIWGQLLSGRGTSKDTPVGTALKLGSKVIQFVFSGGRSGCCLEHGLQRGQDPVLGEW